MALVGPSYLGKKSFVLSELQSNLAPPDILLVDRSIAGAREAISFCSTCPIFSSIRAVLVDDAGGLSEPAQDAYLKLCEETPPNVAIIMVMEDDGYLLSALRSRIRKITRWFPLNSDEMKEFAESESLTDQSALDLCNGRPGLYQLIYENKELVKLYALITEIINGPINSSIISTPKIILDLPSKPSTMREAVALICSTAVKNAIRNVGSSDNLSDVFYNRALSFLQFSVTLLRSPNTNADIYWQKSYLLSV
jgi:hypothetical protein